MRIHKYTTTNSTSALNAVSVDLRGNYSATSLTLFTSVQRLTILSTSPTKTAISIDISYVEACMLAGCRLVVGIATEEGVIISLVQERQSGWYRSNHAYMY